MADGCCEYCAHYVYDDYMGVYTCEVDLDEDEMERFLRGNEQACHYFNPYDEYGIVKKQN